MSESPVGKIEAVVFDLYGTLIHVTRESKPYRKLFRQLGLKIDFAEGEINQARLVAMTQSFNSLRELAKFLRPEAEVDCHSYELEVEEEIAGTVLYPEVINVLKRLSEQGYKLGLISNLATLYKRAFFKLGLHEFFDEILFSCDVGMVKPNPLIYQMMIEALDVAPSRIIMTGDQFSKDVAAPRAAGMRAVHLDRSGSSGDNRIANLDGIFQYL